MKRTIFMLALLSMYHGTQANTCIDTWKQPCTADAVHFFFTDITGTLREIIIPSHYEYKPMLEGLVFDGSSIPGYRSIDESDQPLVPDPAYSIGYLRIHDNPHAYVFCYASTPHDTHITDSRTQLKNAMDRAYDLGYTMSVGAEIEFYLQNPDGSPVDMFSYCQACDDIQLYTMQQDLISFLKHNNAPVEKLHHEVGAGQYEAVLQHNDPLTMADNVMLTSHLIKLYASSRGLRASFAPKPYTDRNGSAMHVHFSLADAVSGINMFAPERDATLSSTAQSFMAGILNRVYAGAAFLNPTHNSYDRLQPGYEAPVAICWSHKNRSALIRLPEVGQDTQNAARAEIRSPDSSSNPYLVFSFLLHAGIDGLRNEEILMPAVHENVYAMNAEERAARGITMLPASQEEAFRALHKEPSLHEAFGSTFIDLYTEALTGA